MVKGKQVDIFSLTYKFIGIKEFIFHTLFKKYIVDTSVASATGFLNIHTRTWDETI
jgi:gluconokinase